MNVFELDHATKVFGAGHTEVRAVDDVTLSVPEGQLVIIMGPSGAGKTTLLQMVGGLLSPTSGRVRVGGRALSDMGRKELARLRLTEVGFIFQSFNLFSALDAQDNIALPARLAGVSRAEATARARKLLAALDLTKRAHHLPEELSGGEQQRVAIARALVNNPPLILADEPTGNLDSASGYQVLHLLQRIARRKHKTVVVVTHDHRIVDAADQLLWFEDGKLRDRERSFRTAVDPVCGMEIVVERAAAHRTIDGETFHLCSQLCTKRFDARPERFAPSSARTPRTTARADSRDRG